MITEAEENIIEASGLEVSVDGLPTVKTFGSSASTPPMEPLHENNETEQIGDIFRALLSDDSNQENVPPLPKKQKTKADTKLVLIEKNLEVSKEYKIGMQAKLDRLIQIQERLLEIKEEKFKRYIVVQEIELEIKKRN